MAGVGCASTSPESILHKIMIFIITKDVFDHGPKSFRVFLLWLFFFSGKSNFHSYLLFDMLSQSLNFIQIFQVAIFSESFE